MSMFIRYVIVTAVLLGLISLLLASASRFASAAPFVATWYGPGHAGLPTASGDIYDPSGYTAASPWLPFGTILTVCYEGCVDVVVNDYGPFDGSDLDLSEEAAAQVGILEAGRAVVQVY